MVGAVSVAQEVQGQVSSSKGHLGSHDVGASKASHNQRVGSSKQKPFDWMSAAYQGAFALAVASMLGTYADSRQLGVAAKLVQQLGSQSQTFTMTVDNTSETMTVAQYINKASTYASQVGSGSGSEKNESLASAWQSAAGQAQAEQSQNVQISQQFTSQETNQATSVDEQTTNQTSSEMQSLNSALGQWTQIIGPINA